MLNKLFGFIGRKKRIEEKMKRISIGIDCMEGQYKKRFALEVADAVSKAKNNRELEETADTYLHRIGKSPLNNHRD